MSSAAAELAFKCISLTALVASSAVVKDTKPKPPGVFRIARKAPARPRHHERRRGKGNILFQNEYRKSYFLKGVCNYVDFREVCFRNYDSR